MNYICDGKNTEYIVKNLSDSFSKMKVTFPNAKLCFSEMLYVGSEETNPSLNSRVKAVNEQMRSYCVGNDMIFISHAPLQTESDDLLDDNVHTSCDGGTAVFVSDMLLLHVQGRRAPFQQTPSW